MAIFYSQTTGFPHPEQNGFSIFKFQVYFKNNVTATRVKFIMARGHAFLIITLIRYYTTI